ncbi:MAG: hypothetical protein HYZ28_06015 [Myxococcales bacterium]|nr:hypothetical protein [Myxococcales bacterium]
MTRCGPLTALASGGVALAAAVTLLVLAPKGAQAFPPYRSTDAETADPWTLEARLGLVRLERDSGENEYTCPLMRLNLGLPHRFELISELEVLPAEARVGDAALGFKWVPLLESISLGIETLALLPVSRQGGAGAEASVLGTYRAGEWLRTHLNAGGFYDARPNPAERGWKAGLLTELRLGHFRPGFEAAAKQVLGGPLQALAGPGIIVTIGPIDIRSGVHFGLTPAAADLTASLWVTSAVPLVDP